MGALAILSRGESGPPPSPNPTGLTFPSANALFDTLSRGGVDCDAGQRRIHFDKEVRGEKAVCKIDGTYAADVYVFKSSAGLDGFLDGLPRTSTGDAAIDALVGANWIVSADQAFLENAQRALGGSLHLPG